MKSFENHEKSKKHKENVANMTMDDDIAISGDDDNALSGDEEEDISDEEVEAEEIEEVKPIVPPAPEEVNVNGTTEEERDNSTSDIEDNDLRETQSDDSDKIQVCMRFLSECLVNTQYWHT